MTTPFGRDIMVSEIGEQPQKEYKMKTILELGSPWETKTFTTKSRNLKRAVLDFLRTEKGGMSFADNVGVNVYDVTTENEEQYLFTIYLDYDKDRLHTVVEN